MRLKLDYSLLILLLFLMLGFLEAGPLGIPAGFLFWAINSLLLPISLVPFLGYWFYKLLTNPFINNLSKFLPLSTLIEKTWIFFGMQALIYCSLTSILTFIGIVLLIWYWRKRKRAKESKIYDIGLKLKDLVQLLDWKDIKELLKELKKKLEELRGKVDKELIGSCLFWLGLGISSHDFWWECEELKVDSQRPTHGVYIGLGLATTGISFIETSLMKNWLHYLGLGACYLGFNLLNFLPKGPSRWVSHIFWWAGISLMTYNWYGLIGKTLFKVKELKGIEELEEVIESVSRKYPRKR